MLKVSSYSVHELIFVEFDIKCHAGLLYGHEFDHDLGHFVTVLSHGALKVRSQGCRGFHWQAPPCAVPGRGPVSKSADRTCLTSLLVQENIPSCCFFSYTESHHYNYGFYVELYPSLHQWLSHTLGNVRDNPSWNRQYRKQYANC